MSIPKEANGHAPELSTHSQNTTQDTQPAQEAKIFNETPNGTTDTGSGTQQPPRPSKPKPKRPNYAQIHSKPLPLTTHPLPAFHPTNPISLLRLTYIYLTQLLFPPSSHPATPYTGLFSPRTRSIHVTDPAHVRALWEMGFFGKGTLSRSEPSWVERERARVRKEGGGAEAATAKRREERRLFKLERARVERERIERQRAVEEGRVLEGGEGGADARDDAPEEDHKTLVGSENGSTDVANGIVSEKSLHEGRVPDAELIQPTEAIGNPKEPTPNGQPAVPVTTTSAQYRATDDDLDLDIDNQEHLQLTLEEAFFLSYSLGLLTIHPPPPSLNPVPFHPGPQPYSNADMLFLSSHHSAFPPVDSGSGIAPDDQFLLNYVVYHHFRSLGWVVRPGLKFGVDYLLYNRGPVFAHAEFGVVVVPSYTHRYWNTPGGRSRRRVHYPYERSGFSNLEMDGGLGDDVGGGDGKDWYWLHCVNRVQSQVRKTLVLCYVDIPSPWEVGLDDEWDADVDIGRLLRGYRVREFVVRRWVPNRSRD